MKRFTILLAAATLSFTSIVWADVPKLINLQGRLTTPTGDTVPNGNYNVTFKIYDASSGGSILWQETQTLTTNRSIFTVILGASVQIPDAVFSGSSRWLGITVSPDPEMTPRQQLVSIGYGYRVSSVDGALGGTISGDLSVTGKATIGPGHTNTGAYAIVAGTGNTVSNAEATVSGGGGNTASGGAATIGGGQDNTASGSSSFVGGGENNKARGIYSVVAGGGGSIAADSNSAIGIRSTVGGGRSNVASGEYATIAGGHDNIASGIRSVIGGGNGNTASGGLSLEPASTVGGGTGNTASGHGSTVGGGDGNQSTGLLATIGGGYHNIAGGEQSTIPGGVDNEASGLNSFAAGAAAKALHEGTFVWSDGTFGLPDPNFGSTAPNQFLIHAQGGVGIGTNNPSTALDVNGIVRATSGFRFQDGTTQTTAYSPGGNIGGSGTTNYIPKFINSTTIDNSAIYETVGGNVGVGLTNPDSKLDVRGQILVSGASGPGYRAFVAIGSSGDVTKFGSTSGGGQSRGPLSIVTNDADRIFITTAGDVGIGTTSPAARLHVNGSAGNNTGVWSTLSDERLKKDIEPIREALATVEQLKGVTFHWKDSKKDAEYGRIRGIIAQDVERVIPEWVKTDPDGYKRIEPIGIDALLIEAIKEQQKTIEELKSRIEKLEKEKRQANIEN